MYRTIVVPVDGSVFSEGALPLAASLARLTDAKLDLVQVLEPLVIEGAAPWHGALDAGAAEYLERLAETLREAGAPHVVTHLLEGSVTERLRTHLESSGADLVVLATHGRGALTRAWLGSVADRLARSAAVPVLLVRPSGGETRSLERASDFQRILLPLDGSWESEVVLEPVLELALPLAAQVTLMRVVEDPVPPGMVFMPGGLPDRDERISEAVQEVRVYLADVAARLELRGVPTTTKVLVHESPAAAILEHARTHPVDLIAMSTHGRGGIERAVLGSVADKVVRASETPVLVFPRASVAVV